MLLYLLFRKNHVFLANDLDSLPANFAAALLKNKPLVYDSHEYFTEVPELIYRPRVKKTWETLEKIMLPHIKYAYTVCNSIAEIYQKKYGVNFKVVRNIPNQQKTTIVEKTGNRNEQKIILYQGAVNLGRGLKQTILAMHFIENAILKIAGDGDLKDSLEQLVEKEKLNNKVTFLGRLPISELQKITPTADLGISVEEDLGLNYRFALPNKLFDYIQAKVPVFITDLPEMKAIVNAYNIGEITKTLEPKLLAVKIKTALFDESKRKIWKKNLDIAAEELTWENEEKVLNELFSEII